MPITKPSQKKQWSLPTQHISMKIDLRWGSWNFFGGKNGREAHPSLLPESRVAEGSCLLSQGRPAGRSLGLSACSYSSTNVLPHVEIVKDSSNSEAKADSLKITAPFASVEDCRNVYQALIHKCNFRLSVQYRTVRNVKNWAFWQAYPPSSPRHSFSWKIWSPCLV